MSTRTKDILGFLALCLFGAVGLPIIVNAPAWALAFIWPGCMVYFGIVWIFFPHLLK